MSHQDSDRTAVWNAVARPPKHALKQIKGGRLQGMTDVNPQWRYQAMTEQFGPCGVGWKYTIEKTWTESGTDGQVMLFALVHVYVRAEQLNFEWSDPVVGIGGSLLIAKEKDGLRSTDEAYKMAVTDALSVALKMLGVAADVYAGRWDGSKWSNGEEKGYTATPQTAPAPPATTAAPPHAGATAIVTLLKAVKTGHASAKGELVTEHGEALLCYDQRAVALAEQLCQNGERVELTLARSTTGNRYVKSVKRAAPAPVQTPSEQQEMVL